MKPLTEQEVRDIVKDEMQKNYMSGSPDVPPHSHNGTDGLNIEPANLNGWTPIPTSNIKFLNPAGRGMVVSVSVHSGGTSYVVGDVIGIGGGAANATAKVTAIGGGGAVSSLLLLRGGTGYFNATSVLTSAGTGSGLTVDITASSYEYGFGSLNVLLPGSLTASNQFLGSPTTAQYPITVVVGNGRLNGKPQGEFQGGASPDGTLVAFINGINADLYLRYQGYWYGVNMTDVI